MTLNEKIREAISASASNDPHIIAKELIGTLDREALIGLLAEEVAHVQRHSVRAAEVAAFAKRHTSGAVAINTVGIDAFRKILNKPIKLGDATADLTWGLLTSAQHQQRVVFLSKQRNGIDNTIRRHEQAIETIEEAGVSCLNDLL